MDGIIEEKKRLSVSVVRSERDGESVLSWCRITDAMGATRFALVRAGDGEDICALAERLWAKPLPEDTARTLESIDALNRIDLAGIGDARVRAALATLCEAFKNNIGR